MISVNRLKLSYSAQFYHSALSLSLCLRQAVLSEDLQPVVSLEALQREEVERPASAGGLLLL